MPVLPGRNSVPVKSSKPLARGESGIWRIKSNWFSSPLTPLAIGEVLRSWLDHFDKRFIGLTGNEAAIEAAQIAANLSPAKKSAVRPDGAYEVGHAAFVLAYTKDNLAHVIYPGGVKEDDWVHDLPYLAKETWTNR